ncbi:MAG: DUF4143 domain-containing protein, partial [Candidatus Enterosoma sp.]|nr:DUF4143 domain-containing protein [bacterium]MDY5909238.1 DUF4143 domain-containing protein [Candidatus Enterosoma sp.]
GKEKIEGYADLTFERLAFVVCRGGWPQAIDMKDEEALKQPRCYYNTFVHSDINKADNIKKNPESVNRLMRSYSRSQGSQVPNTVLVHDDLINDLHTFGFLFETLCIRNLRIYADSLSGEVYHYRDKDDQECDAVIHLRNEKSIDHSLEYCASIYACFIGLRKVISLLFSALQDRHSFSLHLPISSYKLWIAFL